MTKQDHVNYWVKSAEMSHQTAIELPEIKRYLETLFYIHLTIEKYLKAVWVKQNLENNPPYTHDFSTLTNQIDIECLTEHYSFLLIAKGWNIETRYPDYKFMLYKIATKEYIEEQLEKMGKLIQCIQTELQKPL